MGGLIVLILLGLCQWLSIRNTPWLLRIYLWPAGRLRQARRMLARQTPGAGNTKGLVVSVAGDADQIVLRCSSLSGSTGGVLGITSTAITDWFVEAA